MNHFKAFLSMLILCLLTSFFVSGQTKDADATDSISSNGINYADNTFFSPRIINGHSTEVTPQNRLDFKIEHRFGLINQGYSQLFGLDQAYTFIGFEYGIKDCWMVGLNRTLIDKTVAAFTKFALLRQCTGTKDIPLSVSLLLEGSGIGTVYVDPVQNNDFGARLSYTVQVLAARKFTDNLSVQVSPVWIHRNVVPDPTDNKDLFAIGFSASYKITPNLEINGEYYPVIGPSAYYKQNYHNSLSFGIDIHTFGHVFQIMLTNSTDMIEKNFIGETTDDWSKGGLHLGFNLLRKFQL
jgi:hypothetical protein